MPVLNPEDLTFNGKEVMEMSEAIMEQVFAKPAIEQVHTIYTEIKAKKQIAFLGRYTGLMGKPNNGENCAPTATDKPITNTQKFWLPAYHEDRTVECWKNLQDTFFIWATKNGLQKPDLTSTDFAVFLEERLADQLFENILLKVWFNDTDAANFNSSPAGFLTNGTDVSYFNPFDGLWKQIFDILAANPAQRLTITQNAGANYAAQEFTNSDTTNYVVTRLLRNMKKKADTRLTGSPDLMYVVTKSIFDQLGDEMTFNAGNGVSEAYRKFEAGFEVRQLDGIPVVSFDSWDRNILKYQNDGTKLYRPHRAILTTKSQLAVGTEEAGNLAELDPFYDKVDKNYIIDIAFNLDAKFLENYMLMAAY